MPNTLAYLDKERNTAVESLILRIPVINAIKSLSLVADDEAKLARVFVPGKPFLPSLIFANKTGTYLSGEPFRLSLPYSKISGKARKKFIGLKCDCDDCDFSDLLINHVRKKNERVTFPCQSSFVS